MSRGARRLGRRLRSVLRTHRDGLSRCASPSRPIDEGGIDHFACAYAECPDEGTTCVQFSINPQDPVSGDCSSSGSLWITCEPLDAG